MLESNTANTEQLIQPNAFTISFCIVFILTSIAIGLYAVKKAKTAEQFFGGTKKGEEENIEYLRWANIYDIIKQCSLNVRISLHDGFPHIPIQFLLSGRQVVTNCDMPHVNYLPIHVDEESYAEAKVKVMEAIRKVKNEPQPSKIKAARAYYLNILDPEKFKNIIYTILEKGKDCIFQEEKVCHTQQDSTK